MSDALSVYWVFKVSASCSKFQQHTIEVSLEMTGLPCQWTPVANRSIMLLVLCATSRLKKLVDFEKIVDY